MDDARENAKRVAFLTNNEEWLAELYDDEVTADFFAAYTDAVKWAAAHGKDIPKAKSVKFDGGRHSYRIEWNDLKDEKKYYDHIVQEWRNYDERRS